MSRVALLTLHLSFIITAIASPIASAQSMDERADALRKQAEAAYFEMEMDTALGYVDQALSLCVMGCTDEKRASLLVMKGMIVHAARGDEAETRRHFREALALDAAARTDPMLSNPAVEKIFAQTQAQAADPYAAAAQDDNVGAEPAPGESRMADPGPAEGARRMVKWNRVFLEAGYSLTMASAHSNMRAGSTPTLASPGDDPQLDGIPENDGYVLSGTHGCGAPTGGYCVRKTDGLATFAHGLHLGAGYFFSEKFGMAARLRWNPNGEGGPLSNFLLGIRGHFQLTEQRQEGFYASVFGGLMVGQIQVRPKQRPTPPSTEVERPWARTGLGGLEVGAKLGYRFAPNVGVYGSPEIYTLFPDFSFGLQVTAGLELSFGEALREERIPAETPHSPIPPDEDGDGIPDDRDQCPDEAEDFDGFQDQDGCPEQDNDGDGVPDDRDQCPNEPEDMDGFEDEDGCPDKDNDGDGVFDAEDECPLEPGPALNQGCPFPDRDGDGVADRFDNCPDEAGTPENMGCPIPQLVQIEETRIKILDSIYFTRNKGVIERRSFPLLEQLASVINAHPEITHVRIEGHSDQTGRAAFNRKLSQRRAESVMRHLVKVGKVDPNRLSAHGYGPDRPIHPEASTEEEHAENRRVEFVTLTD